MKKTFIRLLSFVFVVLTAFVASIPNAKAADKVPDYYYANYKFIDDWNNIRDTFNQMKARKDLGMAIPSSYFSDIYVYFQNSFDYLTKDFRTVYDKCKLLAQSAPSSESDLESFLGNSCYKSLSQAVSKINSQYTVKAKATATPTQGSAPLTVTFDARNSTDPSSETIPTDNFFRYYRDENGVDTPMGKGNVIKYEFNESGRFIVHLVVRSSNVNDGILDGEQDLTINVSPKAANIVVYANTRKMSTTDPVKIGISEGAKGVIFDGSATMPTGGRKILSYKRTIVNSAIGYSYSKSGEGAPGYINVPLSGNGEYKVTLQTKDNENNTVSETFSLYMSDPVTIIKQTPEKGTTSTTYTFDGSASYSLLSKLNTYIWEIFDENGDKIATSQGKKLGYKFTTPGNYGVRLTVTDLRGETNVDRKEIYVESTPPTAQFSIVATSKWEKPSEFTLDASNSSDVDALNGVDSLEYNRSFSTNNAKIISTENNNEKVVVQFDSTGKHTIVLTVTDQYGRSSAVSKVVEVKSTLRPEITAIPGAITRGKLITFESTINTPVINYVWSYGDGTTTNSQFAANAEHRYGQKGIYNVTLTVYDKDGNSNTVTEKVFIGEVEYPIAAYRVKDSKGYFIQATETCRIAGSTSGSYATYDAYPVDRYANFTINPSISVNTQGNANGLKYVFEPESLIGGSQATIRQELTHRFSMTGCHYVDLTIQDSNVGKQDKVRIRFYVKNALPTVKNVTLSFPQYSDDNAIGFSSTTSNKTQFDCSGANNLTIKVTAVGAADSDGSISRLRFYYYNIDDPDRILEYKETRISIPYAYFVIPRISGEYKFGVMVYDNDGGMIDSNDVLGSNPSVYFPASCNDSDIPTVSLKLSSQNVEVGDAVTYTVVSKIGSNNEDFETSRTFYYDFTGDGVRDLVTKQSSATYTFLEPYEDGVKPRVAVEYRGKLGKGDGAEITVRNGIKPILLYNSYKNNVIFRDLSIGTMQQRQICFDTHECAAGNTKYRRTHIVTAGIEDITGGTQTVITQNDSFLWQYPDFGSYNVSLYLKNKYGIEVQTGFTVKTMSNTSNGLIAPGINMITIPETTFTNSTPEIFLSKVMNNTLLMYVSNETGETCYIDTDISTDSDGDGKTDNDMDASCNTLAKIVYEPSYESAIGRIYFTSEGQLVYKNFYVSFEGYILELDEEKLDIYNDISKLINGIEDITAENTDLKSSLDILRKNLNNINMVSATVVTIQDQLEEGGIQISATQKDLLDSILARLSNSDTIVAVGMDDYERNKLEILAILPTALKSQIEQMFSDFEENMDTHNTSELKEVELNNIRNVINKSDLVDNVDKTRIIQPAFCNIYSYYDILSTSCDSSVDQWVIDHYRDGTDSSSGTSKSGLPQRLKIILIILVGGLLIMGGTIVFFSIKARLNSSNEEDDV